MEAAPSRRRDANAPVAADAPGTDSKEHRLRGDPAEEDSAPGVLQSALALLGVGSGGGGGRRERESLLPFSATQEPPRPGRVRSERSGGAKPSGGVRLRALLLLVVMLQLAFLYTYSKRC